jgi:hypothetical protein
VSGIEVPENAVVVRYVPHGEVLPAAAATVTHAGHGTIAAALAHGVPLVCLPHPSSLTRCRWQSTWSGSGLRRRRLPGRHAGIDSYRWLGHAPGRTAVRIGAFIGDLSPPIRVRTACQRMGIHDYCQNPVFRSEDSSVRSPCSCCKLSPTGR